MVDNSNIFLTMVNTTTKLGVITMKPSIQADAMRRAWVIFRQTYNYPAIKFSDIGRKCFAWALRQAWVEPHATPPTCPIGAGPSMTRRNLMNSIVALPIVTALPVSSYAILSRSLDRTYHSSIDNLSGRLI